MIVLCHRLLQVLNGIILGEQRARTEQHKEPVNCEDIALKCLDKQTVTKRTLGCETVEHNDPCNTQEELAALRKQLRAKQKATMVFTS